MTNENHADKGSWLTHNRRLAIISTLVPFLLLGYLELLPLGKFVPPLLYFFATGIWVMVVTPLILGLPNGRKPIRAFCTDIRLLPVTPLGRNILLGLLMACLTLSGILLASLLTHHFVLDWSTLPPSRWVKGLTRGVWEEVIFRGILLAVTMRFFSRCKAVLLTTAIFAAVHFNFLAPALGGAIDVVSLFFMGLLFTYVVLKTGSLLPAIVFHYVHDIFVLLVQNTPGADETKASLLLYGFLWVALVIGAVLTKFIAEHWPIRLKH